MNTKIIISNEPTRTYKKNIKGRKKTIYFYYKKIGYVGL